MPAKTFTRTVLVALVAIGFHQAAQADQLVISGSSTVGHDLLMPNRSEIQGLAGHQIEINSIGSGNGIKSLSNGNADMAMISAPLGEVISNLNAREPGSINGRELVAYQVGGAEVAFVSHPSNPVRSLRSHQIYDILNGSITNWSEVGGLQMPIQVFVEPPGGGVRSAVEHRLSDWGDHLAAEQYVQSASLVRTAVAQVHGGLGITALAHVDNSVRLIATEEPLLQPFFLVTRGQANRPMMAVIEAARRVSGWRDSGSAS